MLFKVQDWGIFYHPCYYLEDRYKKKPSRVTFDTSVKRLIDKLRETKGKSLVIIDKKEYQVREYLEKENFNIDVVEPDFDHGIFNTSDEKYEAVFFIDSFECVSDIEKLLIDLREGKRTGESKCYGVIANVAFIFTRIMHLFGAFNYGVRGILDFRHKRLFTYSSLKRLLEYHSCKIEKLESISVPWKLVFKSKILVGIISGLWNIGVKLLKGLFAYQYYFEFSSLPSLRVMLERTRENTKKREEELKK